MPWTNCTHLQLICTATCRVVLVLCHTCLLASTCINSLLRKRILCAAGKIPIEIARLAGFRLTTLDLRGNTGIVTDTRQYSAEELEVWQAGEVWL